MLRDIGGSLWGVLLFALALLAPGYALGYCTDLSGFRNAGLREKFAWSIGLSFGTGTIVVVGVVWMGGVTAGAVILLAFGLAAAGCAYKSKPLQHKNMRLAAPYAVLAAALCAITIGSLVDLGFGSRLYMSVTAYDNALRAAFVGAVLRTGVPPASPVYWPGHDAPMRYYYFWYVLCAAVARLGGVSARQALIASSTWSIFGVLAMLALYGRHLLGWRGSELRKRWWMAAGLLTVTGLDGVIALLYFLHSGTVARDIEWWSLDQVTSWADTFLWVPHHAAALVCCLLCILLIHMSHSESVRKRRYIGASIAGVCFASAFGLSTYVAVGMAIIVALWSVRSVFRRARAEALQSFVIAGLTASVILGPYILQLASPQSGARQTAGGVLGFGMREMLPPVVLSGLPPLRALQAGHPYLAKELAAACLLIPSYFAELGFFAIALIFLQRLRHKSEQERTLLFFAWAGLLSVSIVRSRVIAMNDFAVRASLIPQFLLLLVGVLAVERARKLTKFFMLLLLAIGAGTSIYQVILLRTYLAIHEREGVPDYVDLAHRNYVLRDAYTAMQETVPLNARVQFSVPNSSYTGFAQLANVVRQVIVEDDRCNDSFGGEIAPCARIQDAEAKLFSGQNPLSAQEALGLCGLMGANYLVAARWDPVWSQTSGWVWSLPPVVVRPDVRIVGCEATTAGK